MNTLDTTKTVTRTFTLSNGEVYKTVVSNVDYDEMTRITGDARSLALSTSMVVIRQEDGSTVYINPNHIVSVTIHLTEAVR